MMMKDRGLVLLAGGLGTRLGPLARESKALVSVQQRPMHAHHVAAGRAAGIKALIVVMPPHGRGLRESVDYAYGSKLPIRYVEQVSPIGPANAVFLGLEAAAKVGCASACVVMADALLDLEEERELIELGGTWAAVSRDLERYGARSWCHQRPDTGVWHDAMKTKSASAFVGVMGVGDCATVAARIRADDYDLPDEGETEVGMAPIMTLLKPSLVPVSTWRDVGDLESLSAVRTEAFSGRGDHRLTTTPDGWVTKTNASRAERVAMMRLSSDEATSGYFPTARLVPHDATPTSYQTKLVDLPTLAELWLYNPMPAGAWVSIVTRVLDALDRVHVVQDPTMSSSLDQRAMSLDQRAMYVDKPIERLTNARAFSNVTVNNYRCSDVVDTCKKLKQLVESIIRDDERVCLHGDPNFCNVMVSLGTGQVCMVDPRGSFGETEMYGDARYDIAKLRYSWHGFAGICHNLSDMRKTRGTDTYLLERDPVRAPQREALDRLLVRRGYDLHELDVIEASMLLSAVPLHPPEQAQALYVEGAYLVDQLSRVKR